MLKTEQKTGGLSLVGNKIYYKATLIERVLFLCKDSQVYQKNRAEDLHQPYIYTDDRFMEKVTELSSVGRMTWFIKGVGIMNIQIYKVNLDPYTTSYTKMNIRGDL